MCMKVYVEGGAGSHSLPRIEALPSWGGLAVTRSAADLGTLLEGLEEGREVGPGPGRLGLPGGKAFQVDKDRVGRGGRDGTV